ncbi:type 2 lanthipeptide synthetase LanM family protein [Pseudoalteromonas sp. HF66]|uniref:type 2 lanthipeptide synthetase LanM family protein n=1 Tax=Pseudoalteromonas sp. HF66 TaxID=2721559 RepID=UPI00142FA3C7|nr:type 2 lanthipeptide synthetase LanM family protein [Pseudoalteromonas sp. HF66]NIZ06419.1 type 2 lantipeptide synthetase LanM [Pseudoalteromonas sp. HF66]
MNYKGIISSSLSFEERLELIKKNDIPKNAPISLPKFLSNKSSLSEYSELLGITSTQLKYMYSDEFIESINLSSRAELLEFFNFNYTYQTVCEEFINKHQIPIETSYSIFLFYDIISITLGNIKQQLKLYCNKGFISDVYLENSFLLGVNSSLKDIAFETIKFEANQAIDVDWIDSELSSYLKLLCDSEYKEYFFEKYPVLLIKAIKKVESFSKFYCNLICRAVDDNRDIKELLDNCIDELEITGLKFGEGDSHNGSSSVTIVEFNKKEKIVYKPRNVSAEFAYQELLKWIRKIDSSFDFKTCSVIERGQYGWMEYIEHVELNEDLELRKYYFNYGYQLALGHLLRATDFHHENLIACGEFPVLVDLETIIQPLEYNNNSSDNSIMGLSYLHKSSYYTALIDFVKFFDAFHGHSSLQPVFFTEDDKSLFYSDKNKGFSSNLVEKTVRTHLPNENIGTEVLRKYKDSIINGFKECYNLLLTHKRELLSSKLLESIFDTCEVRVVLRYTNTYTQLIDALNSPYALSHFKYQDEYSFKLLKAINEFPNYRDIALREITECSHGDVPYFSNSVSSQDLKPHNGDEFKNILKDKALKGLLRDFLNFNRQDMYKEIDVIKYALSFPLKQEVNVNIEESKSAPCLALKLFHAIHGRVLSNMEEALIVEPVTSLDLSTRMSPLKNDLYSGYSGIALAMAYAGIFFNVHSFTEKSKDIVNHILNTIDVRSSYFTGACEGLGGIIYMLSHVGTLWEDSYFLDIAKSLAEKLNALTFRDRNYDLFFGSSGAILSLLSLYSTTKDKEVLQFAKNCGDHLLLHSEVKDGFLQWKNNSPDAKYATTGFAHGVAGILYSLLKLYEVTDENKYLAAVIDGEKYIKKCYSKDSFNWFESYDDVVLGKSIEGQNIWCHGAPGISLFYFELYRITGSLEYKEFLDSSQQIILESIPYDNDSLCHGTLGNVELLKILNQENCLSKIDFDEIKKLIFEHLKENYPRCGTFGQFHSVSLYTGFSGIAYQILRLYENNNLPSLLTFEVPRGN